ncbi:ALP1-like protein [Tanacetum coccineum]
MNSDNLFFYDTDNKAEVNSLVFNFLKDVVLVIQASTPTIRINPRNHIVRDCCSAHDRLVKAYFAKEPLYDDYFFHKRFRMSRALFTRIVRELSDNCPFFQQGYDVVGKAGISTLVKCTFAVCQLAYDAVPDALDEYLQIRDKTSRYCLMAFCNGVMELYGEEFLREPTQTDVEKIYAFHEEKHVFPGSNNDINFLCQLPVLNDLKVGKTPEVPFVANDMNYKLGYYLTNGIYPEWTILIKLISQPGSNDTKRIRYKQAHETARKDVERAFEVLKKKVGYHKNSCTLTKS